MIAVATTVQSLREEMHALLRQKDVQVSEAIREATKNHEILSTKKELHIQVCLQPTFGGLTTLCSACRN